VNSNPRQIKLLEVVRAHGSASVEQLAEQLGVTLQTVRRDVQRLADAGFLSRFHGGVRVPSSTVENIAYRQRESLNAEGKARIAQAVAGRVPNGCSLMLNIGTTTEAVARALLHHQGLRVITNNLNVAEILCSNTDCEVIVAGGVVRARDRGIVGEAAVDFMRQFRVDIAVIGISGIEADGSLRDFDYREVKVAQTIIAHAREVWLAADSSKFNRPAMVELARLSQIDQLFTDQAPPEPFPALLKDANVRCDIAEAAGSNGMPGSALPTTVYSP
jgi:DeoR family transcriptional regulator, glycerol-3-phosphate regulon repressor